MDHLSELNDAQKNAVLSTEGPLLVLAGAGSGKTRVITHRILHLILEGTSPHNILAVTFTNKAAKEMRERVINALKSSNAGNRAALDGVPTVTTFHSLGVRILREHHKIFGLKKQFAIYDRSDSLKAVKKGLESADYDIKRFEPRKILSTISRAKGDAETPISYKENTRSFHQEVVASVWEYYEKFLREEHALDFDDLLAKTLSLLKSHPDILKQYQDRYKYIHVDEYQDTNKVQFEIVRLLVGEPANICVVGDVDQSIYSWRGADMKNILQFEKHFPERSRATITDLFCWLDEIIPFPMEIRVFNA